MRKFKKILISIVSLCLVCCVALSVACTNKKNTIEQQKVSIYEGTHVRTAKLSSKEFIKEGSTNYTIIIPQDADQYELIAKDELVKFFEQATGIRMGVTMDVVNGEAVTHSANQKYISIGHTTLLDGLVKDNEINVDYETLGKEGARIKTIGNNIYLSGSLYVKTANENPQLVEYNSYSLGTIWAVYTFLEIAFNYSYFWYDCWEIDENVTDLNLYNFDVTEIPDIENRSGSMGVDFAFAEGSFLDQPDIYMHAVRNRTPYAYWYNMMGTPQLTQDSVTKEYIINASASAQNSHNNLDILLPAKYKNEHPSWYSGNDLCFTCGGAEAGEVRENERDLMMKEIAKRSLETLMYNQNKYYDIGMKYLLPVTMEDGTSACDCNSCAQNTEKYGAYASNLILAMHDIIEEFEILLAEEKKKCEEDPNYSYEMKTTLGSRYYRYEDYYREDWAFTFFAYAYGTEAPVVEDETGNLVANYPEMMCGDRIVPWYAETLAKLKDYYNEDDEVQAFHKITEGWGALTKERGFIYWGYVACYFDPFLPFDSWQENSADHIKLLAKCGAKNIFLEARLNNGTKYAIDYTGFEKFNFYVYVQSAWDSNIDYQTIKTKYFNAMYQDAADTMMALYERIKVYGALIVNTYDGFTTGTDDISSLYWYMEEALVWIDMCDKALTEIEYLKQTDINLYNKTKKHINAEYCAGAYILIHHYNELLSQDQALTIKPKLAEICTENGFYLLQDELNKAE